MGEFIKQTTPEVEVQVDEMFERSDKVVHGLFNAMVQRIRVDYITQNGIEISSNGIEV